MDNTEKKQKTVSRNRTVFSLVWWLVLVVISMVIAWLTPLGPLASAWGIVTIFAIMIFQAAPYWFILNYFFPMERRQNIKSALIMLFLVMLGAGFFSYIIEIWIVAHSGD